MQSLFAIIGQYKDKLSLLPIMILLAVAATLLCYILFSKMSKLKYVPGLVGIFAGLLFIILGFSTITSPSGLTALWRGVSLFVAGWIGIGTAWLCLLIQGLLQKEKAAPSSARPAPAKKKTGQRPAQPSKKAAPSKARPLKQEGEAVKRPKGRPAGSKKAGANQAAARRRRAEEPTKVIHKPVKK